MADQKITELDPTVAPVDADLIETVQDVATTPLNKKITWTTIKAFFKTYFDTLYDALGSASTVQGNLNTHTGNTSNPHSVTKAQVGLTNVTDDAQVKASGDQTVAGIKTFSSFPVTPSSAPTTNYQTANKKYVDDNAGGGIPALAPYTVGALDAIYVKLYYNVHALFELWTGSVYADGSTLKVNWVRTDATKVVVANAGNMASFESTASALLYVNAPFYSASSTALAFLDNNIIIMDFWAKYASGAGQNLMGIAVAGTLLYTSAMQPQGVFFSFKNGVIYTITGPGGAAVEETNVGAGITETNWNNYRIEFDMGTDTVLFYINGTLVKTSTGATIPSTGTVSIGFGRYLTNPVLFNVTAPNISLEMNP